MSVPAVVASPKAINSACEDAFLKALLVDPKATRSCPSVSAEYSILYQTLIQGRANEIHAPKPHALGGVLVKELRTPVGRELQAPAPDVVEQKAQPVSPKKPPVPRSTKVDLEIISQNLEQYAPRILPKDQKKRTAAAIYGRFAPQLYPVEPLDARVAEFAANLRRHREAAERKLKETGVETVIVILAQESYSKKALKDALVASGYKWDVFHANSYPLKPSEGGPKDPDVEWTTDLAIISSHPLQNKKFIPVNWRGTEFEHCMMNAGPRYIYGLATAQVKIGEQIVQFFNRHPPPRFEDETPLNKEKAPVRADRPPGENGPDDGFYYLASSGSPNRMVVNRLMDDKRDEEVENTREVHGNNLVVVDGGDSNCYSKGYSPDSKTQMECHYSANATGFYQSSELFADNGPNSPDIVSFDPRTNPVVKRHGEARHGTIDQIKVNAPISSGVLTPNKEMDHHELKVRVPLDTSKPPEPKPPRTLDEEMAYIQQHMEYLRLGIEYFENDSRNFFACVLLAPESTSEDINYMKGYLAGKLVEYTGTLAKLEKQKNASGETRIAVIKDAPVQTPAKALSLSQAAGDAVLPLESAPAQSTLGP